MEKKEQDLYLGYAIWFGGKCVGWYSNYVDYLVEVNRIKQKYPESFYHFNLTPTQL
jgi:hypothetical protein